MSPHPGRTTGFSILLETVQMVCVPRLALDALECVAGQLLIKYQDALEVCTGRCSLQDTAIDTAETIWRLAQDAIVTECTVGHRL